LAKIYISYSRNDLQLVLQLAERLRNLGHEITVDVDTLSAGIDWRSTLDEGLRSSEIFIVVVSQYSTKSQHVLAEVGAARAYSLESGRMLVIPVIIDDSPLPLPLQDIHAIFQSGGAVDEIVGRIEAAISSFVGRRVAIDVAATEVAQKIQTNAADYIRIAIESLAALEVRDRWLGYLWHALGFASLVVGIAFSVWSLSLANQQPTISTGNLLLVALKSVVVIGLLGACAKYAFSLGKSYASEALKSSDRMHAIRYGEFYLRAFGEKTKWEEIKEVFQHWNIDRNSAFAALDATSFDPKLIESMLELARLIPGKGNAK
jgi:uncharacterized membrane protein YecN with MAPEG domain